MRRTGKRERKGRRWSNLARTAGTGALLALSLCLLPGLAVRPMEGEAALLEPLQPTAVPASRDGGRVVRLLQADGSVQEMTMADYLWGVVAAEMPASFEEEALKAQACAARTYTVGLQSRTNPKHENAHLCGDSTCCQAYKTREEALANWGDQGAALSEKITRAVAQTDGLGVLYGGKPIQAVFFSSAAGQTVDAVAVWGNSVDYLKSVDSPEGEEVPNWRSQVVLSAREVREKTAAKYPAADLSGSPDAWFQDLSRSEGGHVTSLRLGGVTLTGSQVRTLFGLRSASFTVDCRGEQFTFSVTGYGHGVGMSQYGANAMAKEGKGFREILTWYYSGTEVGNLW